MKYIKIFENINKNDKCPKLMIGYYIIVKIRDDRRSYVNLNKINFFESHIGKVDELKQDYLGVKFDQSFDDDYYFIFNYDEIEFYSKNKKDAEMYLISKKYNL